jgi:hypothetical protein
VHSARNERENASPCAEHHCRLRRCFLNVLKEANMAKRKKSKSRLKSKRKTKTRAKKTKRKKTARKSTAGKSTPKAKKAKRKTSAAKKRRTSRRNEADLSWPEVRASRRRKGAGREDRIVREFDRVVNMTPQAIEKWLKSSEARETGTPRSTNASESAGHWSGHRILEIKKKKADDYTSEDYAHMRKVTAYVKRHSAQRPEGDAKETPWRYALMNWGHDPLK